jgi:hypothetical protein
MTAYVTATLQNLLLRRFARADGASASQPRGQAHAQAHAVDAAETMPMLFRSEGFAEDLFDSHPFH